MCWVILKGQQIYTVIQAVHSLLYIVAKCNFFSVVTWKGIIQYLQKCEGCTHFCEILYIKICDSKAEFSAAIVPVFNAPTVIFFQDSLINRKKKINIYLKYKYFFHFIIVFTVTFDQFNAQLLIKSIESTKLTPNFWTVKCKCRLNWTFLSLRI